MGTGKSVVGKALAKDLKLEFIDLDAQIESQQARSIQEIFAKEGEPFFRRLEQQAVKTVAAQRDLVVACGGGVVVDKENLDILKKTGTLVCLSARPEVAFARCKDTCVRPLLNIANPQKEIERLLLLRAPFYSQAHFSIDTSDISPQEAARQIIQKLKAVDD